MPYYRRVGDVPRKRHLRSPGPDGRLLYEELMGEEGFSGQSSLLYHLRSPSALVGAGPVEAPGAALAPNDPLLPRHLHTSKLAPGGDAVSGRRVLLGNDDVTIAWVAADRTSPLRRNAVGDELAYVQDGEGVLESVFGRLPVSAGEYVVVPRSATHRWVVPDGGRLELLVVETAGHVRPPGRYRTTTGQFLEAAPYCERDVRGPEGPLVAGDDGPADVLVRHRAGTTRSTSSAGTAACTPGPCRSSTSSRWWGPSTSRPTSTRPSRGRGSWSARSSPGPTTSTRGPSRSPTTTPTWTATR
jgi:homogentisate 1,2-dioxygenase